MLLSKMIIHVLHPSRQAAGLDGAVPGAAPASCLFVFLDESMAAR